MTELIPQKALEGDPFSKWELTVKESFSLDALYKRLHEFLIVEEWVDLHAGGDDYEINYEEHEQDDGSINHFIWWRAAKDPKIPAHDYIRYYLRLDFTTKMIKEKEVMLQGKKVKLDNGELKVECGIYLHQDNSRTKSGKNPWKTHPVLKHFKNYFWNRLNRKVVSAAKGEIVEFSNDLYNLIQVFTGVKPESGPRDFVPVKGVSN
ncbi:MAG: hypothetical protein ACQESE_04790 [Nanobdellota archaeon]